MSCVQASSDRNWTPNSLSSSTTLPALYGCPHGRPTAESCSTELSRNQTQYYLPPSPQQTLPPKRLRKMPKSSTLSVTLSHPFMADDGPRSPRSPRIPTSTNRESVVVKDTMDQANTFGGNVTASAVSLSRDPTSGNELPKSPTFTSLPSHPTSPKSTTSHAREPSHSFFANLQASKSSSRIEPADLTIRHVTDGPPSILTYSEEDSLDSLRRTPGSTPDLSSSNLIDTAADQDAGMFSIPLHVHCSRSHTHCYVQIAHIKLLAEYAHQLGTSPCPTACYLRAPSAIFRRRGVNPSFLVC